jgi:hypothetical protein
MGIYLLLAFSMCTACVRKVPGIGGAALAVVAYVIPLLRGNNLPTVAGLLMSEHTHLTLRAR